ncbi:MAG: phosphotransferase [Gammaproteobacteria bacterium]|nr:phosphotransferase [Gammaproteobacteria bacterium]
MTLQKHIDTITKSLKVIIMQGLKEDLKQLESCYFKKSIKEDAATLLGGGFSFARNYRIEDGGKTYFVRFFPTKQLLVNNEKECCVTEYAGRLGVGAKVYYQNPQQGIIITEFIQGRIANYYDMVNEPNRNLIIANIKKLHQAAPLELPKAPTLTVLIEDTLKRADAAILQQQLEAFGLIAPLNSLLRCAEKNFTPVFIHGDLNPNNILIGKNRVNFIDWSDAGIGDPFADISWHAIFFPLSLHDNLLDYYFDHIDNKMRQKLLCYYCLRLFKFIAWGVEQAKKISQDSENLLVDIIKQQNLPEPYYLMVGMFTNKINLSNPSDFLLVSATMLRFLSQFTKTDTFLSAIEGLSHNV